MLDNFYLYMLHPIAPHKGLFNECTSNNIYKEVIKELYSLKRGHLSDQDILISNDLLLSCF